MDRRTRVNFAADTNPSDGINRSPGTPPLTGQAAVFTDNFRATGFTAGAGSSFAKATGDLGIDGSWGGRIAVTRALPVSGDFSLAGGSSAVAIAGSDSRWVGQTALGGTAAAPTFGRLVSTLGTVAPGGSVRVTSTEVRAVGTSVEALANQGGSPISGTFKERSEGVMFTVAVGMTTEVFEVTYVGRDADSDEDVLITRIA
jgi:hypothetical protein